MANDTKKKHSRKFPYEFFLLALFMFFISLLPYLFTRQGPEWLSFRETGQIGDTIGGTMTPFIALLTLYYAYKAYTIQMDANDTTKEHLIKQGFDNNLLTLLSQLQNIEKEVNIEGVGNSKQAFHFMLYEYKAISVLINIIADESEFKGLEDDFKKKMAFDFFLNGVSITSTLRLRLDAKCEQNKELEDKFINRVNESLLYIQKEREKRYFFIPYLDDYTGTIKHFDGHRSRIVPFYRIFCKIIEFIGFEYKEDIIKSPKIYVDLILAQFSEHEISLLKIINRFNSKESEYYIHIDYQEEINKFFCKLDNEWKVDYNQYINSSNMDCDSENFISADNFTYKSMPEYFNYIKNPRKKSKGKRN